MPYASPINPEEAAALKLKVERNEKEIEELRKWRHDMVQKPNADGLRFQGIEMLLAGQDKVLQHLSDQNDRLLTTLNGDDDKPGIKGRLDRVEGKMSTLTRFLWIIAGTAAAVFVKTFWSVIAGGKP